MVVTWVATAEGVSHTMMCLGRYADYTHTCGPVKNLAPHLEKCFRRVNTVEGNGWI